MAKEKTEYTVVVPVFNSEHTLNELYSRLHSVFEELKVSFDVVFVDDGSMDGSWKVLNKIKNDNPEKVTAIKLDKNFGQHNAIMCGFDFAEGECIITIDDDLQNPPEEIKKLIETEKTGKAELVYGTYKKKQHSYTRNLGSKYAKHSIKRVFKRPSEGSSFRLISKELVNKMLQKHHHFIYLDEILQWYTDNIAYVEVKHLKRPVGKSGYNSFTLLRYIANALFYYTNIPLKLMVYGGFVASLVFFVLSVIYIISKLVFNVPLGFTSIIVGIMFSTSLIMFCLGIIGEYLSRIYYIQNKKPPYSIKKVL